MLEHLGLGVISNQGNSFVSSRSIAGVTSQHGGGGINDWDMVGGGNNVGGSNGLNGSCVAVGSPDWDGLGN